MRDSDEALTGELAPPMANGEVVFEAPWQGRVFGMARAMAQAGLFGWDDFRARLIAEIREWDRAPEGDFAYYDHFLRALEAVLAARGLVTPEVLSAREAALHHRPHGHDHPPPRAPDRAPDR